MRLIADILLGSMLQEDPKKRPNVFQVLQETSSMTGRPVTIKDVWSPIAMLYTRLIIFQIYSDRTRSEARGNQKLPPTPKDISNAASPPPVGISHAAPQSKPEELPQIAPMRRGRPVVANQIPVSAQKPSSSTTKGDPFAALDSSSFQVRAGAVEELSKKFPSLDDFSITHDKSGTFPFSRPATDRAPASNMGIAQELADEVFASTRPVDAAGAGLPEVDPSLKPIQASKSSQDPVSYTHLTLPTKRIV